jgi:hypothetical protein
MSSTGVLQLGDRCVLGFHDSSCREFLVIEDPELSNPEPSRSSDMHPHHEWIISHREIVGRDFLMHNFFTIETPINKTLKAPNPLPTFLADERPGLILGVLGLMRSWFSWPRELR